MRVMQHRDGKYMVTAYLTAGVGQVKVTADITDTETGQVDEDAFSFISHDEDGAIDALSLYGEFHDVDADTAKTASTENVGKTFITARRRFSMEKQLELINEDIDDADEEMGLF